MTITDCSRCDLSVELNGEYLCILRNPRTSDELTCLDAEPMEYEEVDKNKL